MIDDDRAPAIAYLRTDLCGRGQEWDERRMEKKARRLGYELRATIRVDSGEAARLSLLLAQIHHYQAEAVFVTTIDHLDGQLDRIVHVADVIDLHGGCFARRPSIAELMGVDAPAHHHDVDGST